MEKPKRLEFHIAYDCVQHCLFCSEHDRLRRFRGKSVFAVEAVRELLKKRAEGFTHVTFTGGEPTLVEDFPTILKCAKKMGFTTYMTSNGQILSFNGMAERIFPSLDELCLSIHGPQESIHDALVRNPGSFQRIFAVIDYLKSWRRPLYLFVNTVVTCSNVHCLHGIMDVARRSGKFKHYIVSYMAPEGGALRNFSKLAVPYSEISKGITGLILHAKRLGVTLRFFGMPACVLGKHKEFSNDFYFSSRVTLERSYRGGRVCLRQVQTLVPTRKRVYLPRCRKCTQKGRCGGIFKRYLKEFGDAEFHPV